MSDLSETFIVKPEDYTDAVGLLADAFASYSMKGFDTSKVRQWLIDHGAETDWEFKGFLEVPASFFWLTHLIDHLLRHLGAIQFECHSYDVVHEIARTAKIRDRRLVRDRRGAIYTALDDATKRQPPGARAAARRVCRRLAKYLLGPGLKRMQENIQHLKSNE